MKLSKVEPSKSNSTEKSCLNCKLFSKCKDPKKSFAFFCNKHEVLPNHDPEKLVKKKEYAPSSPIILPPISKDEAQSDDEYNLQGIIDKVFTEGMLVPPDLEIDDKHLPQAENFFQFVTDPKFIDVNDFRPFAKQIQVGINLYQEYCPYCSKEGYVQDIPIDATPDQINENVVHLKYGVCPKCKSQKSQLINDGFLMPYTELAGCAGQRCITGDSLVLTVDGIMSMDSIANLHSSKTGFMDYVGPNLSLEHGQVVKPSKFFKSKSEKVIKVKTKDGKNIIGTYEHPIKTIDGFKKLSEIRIGDVLPITYGQNHWGIKKVKLWNVNAEANKRYEDWRKNLVKNIRNQKRHTRWKSLLGKGNLTPEHAKLLGFWVAEGSGNILTNHDLDVKDFCYEQFCTLYNKDDVVVREFDVALTHRKNIIHFDILLEGAVLGKHRSAQKRIPSYLLNMPKEYISAFLQGLFEGDGGTEGRSITYCSLSKLLIHQISCLLNNYGIIHTVSKFKTWASNGSINQISKCAWRITICGYKPMKTFEKEIGFFSNRKKLRLRKVIRWFENKKQINMPHWYDKFPNRIKQEFLDLLKDINGEISKYNIWSKRRGFVGGLENHYGIGCFFHQNTGAFRIYADNVALSRSRLKYIYKEITNHPVFYKYLSDELKFKFDAFYKKYTTSNTYWVNITKTEKLKYKQKTYDFVIPNHHRFIANGILNHNSGKTFLTSLLSCYNLHRHLKTNPNKVYGLPKSQPLQGTYAALNFDQAKANIWTPIYNFITTSPWYKELFVLLDDVGRKKGEELYRIKDTYYQFRYKNLIANPTGPSKRTMRGYSRFDAACDEIGWFNILEKGKTAEKMDADEVYTALSRSFKTLRSAHARNIENGQNNVPSPMFYNISSPSSRRDMIMKLWKQSKNSPQIYGFRAATWEFNPTITREDLKVDFDLDYAKAMRDFGAKPASSGLPFIGSQKHVIGLYDDYKNGGVIKTWREASPSGRRQTLAKVEFADSGYMTRGKARSVLSIDAGFSNNSFGIVIANINPIEGYAQFPFVGEIIPIKDYPLDFNNIYNEVLWPLVKHYNVCVAITDRWQGKKFMADLEADAAKEFSYPLLPIEHSAKYQDFEDFRQAIYDAAISLPQLEMSSKKAMDLADIDSGKKYPECFRNYPLSHSLFQFMTVQDHVGSSVEKGESGTDDIFRAMVLAHKVLTNPELHDLLIGEGFEALKKALGAYSSGSSVAGSAAISGSKLGAFSTMSNANRMLDLTQRGKFSLGSTGSGIR